MSFFTMAPFITANFQINPAIYSVAQMIGEASASLYNSMHPVIEGCKAALQAYVNSPFVQWISSFDFTPLRTILEDLNFDSDVLKRYRELEQEYLYVNGVYNDNRIMEFNEAWYKYLSELANEYIVDTHANMPEINEYILHE